MIDETKTLRESVVELDKRVDSNNRYAFETVSAMLPILTEQTKQIRQLQVEMRVLSLACKYLCYAIETLNAKVERNERV